MNEEYRAYLDKAAEQYPEVRKRMRNWKKRKPKQLDPLFHQAHDEAFQEIDCLQCANCCKTTSPIFRDVDIERLAKHLRMKPGALIDQHLHMDEDGHYVLNVAPCPFLGADNFCSVYEHRPQACREYPHTNRKHMHQILDLTATNTQVCPAAQSVVEKISKVLQVRGGRKR